MRADNVYKCNVLLFIYILQEYLHFPIFVPTPPPSFILFSLWQLL